jgi:single-strand DNA-binding protein
MNNLNSVLLEGNLVRDPEISYSNNSLAFCRFSVATNRYYKQNNKYEQEVSYFDVKTWGKQAEICNEYLKKGRGVRIIGRLKQDRWKADDGVNRSKVVVYAEHVEFKPQYNKASENGSNQNDPGPQSNFKAKKESVLV